MPIAESIFDVARRQAAGRRLAKVTVRVGAMHRVVPSSLSFGFELAAQGTELEGAELEVHEIPTVLLCRACGNRGPGGSVLACPACGGFDTEVVEGEELIVESIELKEDPATA